LCGLAAACCDFKWVREIRQTGQAENGREKERGKGLRFLLDLHNNARISAACARTYRPMLEKGEEKREKKEKAMRASRDP